MFSRNLRHEKLIARLGIPLFIIGWCLCWYSSIGSSFRRSLEDWQKFTRPNQGAAANRRPAGQSDKSDNFSATLAANRDEVCS